jgi:hypothetical protein
MGSLLVSLFLRRHQVLAVLAVTGSFMPSPTVGAATFKEPVLGAKKASSPFRVIQFCMPDERI